MKSARRPKERSYSPYEISEPVCKTSMDILGETLGLKTIFFDSFRFSLDDLGFISPRIASFLRGKHAV